LPSQGNWLLLAETFNKPRMGVWNDYFANQHAFFFYRSDAGRDRRSHRTNLARKHNQTLAAGLIPSLDQLDRRRLHRAVRGVNRRSPLPRLDDPDGLNALALDAPLDRRRQLGMNVLDDELIEHGPRGPPKPRAQRGLNVGDIPADHDQVLAARDD